MKPQDLFKFKLGDSVWVWDQQGIWNGNIAERHINFVDKECADPDGNAGLSRILYEVRFANHPTSKRNTFASEVVFDSKKAVIDYLDTKTGNK